MESLISEGERPPLIVACSDRPTRDLVLSARHCGADDFLVLPTTRKRLLSVLAGALQHA
jgi:FixJ family two-component response regulator